MSAELYNHIIEEAKLLINLTALLNDAKDALKEQPLYIDVAKQRIDYALSQLQSRIEALSQ
jgi:hypothetical protein